MYLNAPRQAFLAGRKYIRKVRCLVFLLHARSGFVLFDTKKSHEVSPPDSGFSGGCSPLVTAILIRGRFLNLMYVR